MRHLDLFSGIGGFSLAAEWAWGSDYECVGFVEIDKFCQKVLKKNFPDVPIYDNIFNVKGDEFGTVDLITGGFPCQPFSVAGKQRGKNDERYLWPEMLRICKIVKPQWIIAENVSGILSLDNGKTFEEILLSLENINYWPEVYIIPACSTKAPHRRDRVWIVANSVGKRRTREKSNEIDRCNNNNQRRDTEIFSQYSNSDGLLRREHEAGVRQYNHIKPIHEIFEINETYARNERNTDGVSSRMDRLKSLGNSSVPQVAHEIMKFIKQSQEDLL